VTAGSGSEMAADARGDDFLPLYRQLATRTLKAAWTQGRLTEDEYEERAGQASASQSLAELVALLADLPVDLMNARVRPPTRTDVWTGVGVIITAAGVASGMLLWHPGHSGASLVFIIAAVILLVAPIPTIGMMIDVRRQERSGRQLSPGLCCLRFDHARGLPAGRSRRAAG